ncbi:MAG: CofH family radical SAM protein [Solidesulfovibrio sp.]|uniref:radical SAM protein n=1 Tax=Solidesulfovibrio sp. TaxID=2910990 RepID=UPI0031596C97
MNAIIPDYVTPDAETAAILAKARAGQRLTPDEALILAVAAPLHELCGAAMTARLARHGRNAYYVHNVHINFTNVCVNACRFCAFFKAKGAAGARTLSVADIVAALDARGDAPIREIHVVGGLNPELPLEYYLDMLRAIGQARPDAGIKAFTAVEVAHLADTRGVSEYDILGALADAGLMMLPGGGAEVFAPALREKLCPEKISGERWLQIHATAHGMGLPTNATMLFGHIENWADRIAHLSALRDLQDLTGGFTCFIPLAYQPANNALGAKGPDGVTVLRLMAVSRLFLDNIPHLKAYWAMLGIKAAQMALWAGADDFDGTIVEERIGHAAGADSPKGLTLPELRQAIEAAGMVPVERTPDFRPLT